jgi:hypothetical protein
LIERILVNRENASEILCIGRVDIDYMRGSALVYAAGVLAGSLIEKVLAFLGTEIVDDACVGGFTCCFGFVYLPVTDRVDRDYGGVIGMVLETPIVHVSPDSIFHYGTSIPIIAPG